MKSLKYLIHLILCLTICTANALPCNTGGMDVLKLADGSGFMFYVYSEQSDIAFTLPGANISFPDKERGNRFYIDKLLFEYTPVELANFTKSKNLSTLEALQAHAAYEQDYLKSFNSPLKKIKIHGPKAKPAVQGQPEFLFYLWEMQDPTGKAGASQFYLSTLAAQHVFLLSMIASDEASETAIEKLRKYVNSFHYITSTQQCRKL